MRVRWAALALATAACTSVKLVNRDGCWIRRIERPAGRVAEELGPCAKTESPWAQDPLTRLAQECMARADQRWQGRALAAWSRGDPVPEQDRDPGALQACIGEASRAMAKENEGRQRSEALSQRLSETIAERDALRAAADEERRHLRISNDKLADHLGDAAKKAQAPASATATARSEGRLNSDTAATLPASSPLTVVTDTAPSTARSAAKPSPRSSLAQSPQRAGGSESKASASPDCDARERPGKQAGPQRRATGQGNADRRVDASHPTDAPSPGSASTR
ncbi:MAG TPA: hypothetical protein VMK12_26785 [Anaeromyxobacteraceae bacterium]|nr:hypothetical protein [Anaeromyxobacteraceae bacterium]